MLLTLGCFAIISSAISALAIALINTEILRKIAKPLALIATGILITLSLAHLIPEAFESNVSTHTLGLVLCLSLFSLLFFDHVIAHNIHKKELKSSLPLFLGSSLHSFCDGAVIASALMVDLKIAIAILIAIMFHEIPRLLSDCMVLLSFGLKKSQCLYLYVATAITALIGALLTYTIIDNIEAVLPFALVISAASFLYVALFELMPNIYFKDKSYSKRIKVILIFIGVIIALLISHHH